MKMHMKPIIALYTLLTLTACSSLSTRTPHEAWIDVRTPAEYQASSIAGHSNIPHTEIADRIVALVPVKSTPVYLYCGSGRRAGLAKEALEGMGYTNVTNVGTIDDARTRLGILSTTDGKTQSNP